MDVAIITFSSDFHGFAVKQAFEQRYNARCHIIETDKIADSGGLTWATDATVPPTLPTSTGEMIDVHRLGAIWWRRPIPYGPLELPPYITEPAHIDIITQDCRSSFWGLVLNEFRGRWISHPEPSRVAENKLVQLRAAQQVGLRIPDTLISQDPKRIRAFCAAHAQQVIVKPLNATTKGLTLTTMVQTPLLESDASLRLCPTIYQEYVPGTRHLRINCFGDAVYSAMIESPDLDWRPNLEVPISSVDIDQELLTKLQRLLDVLGLRMGIFDVKLTDDGEPVWLEINPQGQFLFLEGLCGLPLTRAFCDFLYEEAQRAAHESQVNPGFYDMPLAGHAAAALLMGS